MAEINVRTGKAEVTQAHKRRHLARLADIQMVTEKKALEKLSRAELLDQTAVRGVKGCQRKKKEELVALCLHIPERFVDMGVDLEDFNVVLDDEIPAGLIVDDDLSEDD